MKSPKRSQGDGEFACVQCGARFATLQALGGHKSVHTGKKKGLSHNSPLHRFRFPQFQFQAQSLSDSAVPPPAKRSRQDDATPWDHPGTSSCGSPWMDHVSQGQHHSPLYSTPPPGFNSGFNSAAPLPLELYNSLRFLQALQSSNVALPHVSTQYASSAPSALHPVLPPLAKGHVAAQGNGDSEATALHNKTVAEFFLATAAMRRTSSPQASHRLGVTSSNFSSDSDSGTKRTRPSGDTFKGVLPAEPLEVGRAQCSWQKLSPEHQSTSSWKSHAAAATDLAPADRTPSKPAFKRAPPSCGLDASAMLPQVAEKVDLTLRLSLV